MTTRPNCEIGSSCEDLIPEVWADVERGLAKEQDRLHGYRFVTVVLMRSFDFKGLTEWIYQGRRWIDAKEAQAHIKDEFGKCVGLIVRARAYSADPPRKWGLPLNSGWPQSSLWSATGRSSASNGGMEAVSMPRSRFAGGSAIPPFGCAACS